MALIIFFLFVLRLLSMLASSQPQFPKFFRLPLSIKGFCIANSIGGDLSRCWYRTACFFLFSVSKYEDAESFASQSKVPFSLPTLGNLSIS